MFIARDPVCGELEICGVILFPPGRTDHHMICNTVAPVCGRGCTVRGGAHCFGELHPPKWTLTERHWTATLAPTHLHCCSCRRHGYQRKPKTNVLLSFGPGKTREQHVQCSPQGM